MSDDGIPVVLVGTSPALATGGCPGGTATFEITLDGEAVASGGLSESPAGSGQYSGQTGPLNAVGDADVSIAIDCPGATPDETVEFGLYIDPSGHVRDSLGAPVADATVELLRSANPAGPFMPVPNGSAVMSPSNRTNSDLTDADGHFGWDVVAGYYKVRASKDGCVSNADRSAEFAESHVMTIPPPVTNLDIRLYCGEGGGGPGGGNGGGGGCSNRRRWEFHPREARRLQARARQPGADQALRPQGRRPGVLRLGGQGRVQGLDLSSWRRPRQRRRRRPGQQPSGSRWDRRGSPGSLRALPRRSA